MLTKERRFEVAQHYFQAAEEIGKLVNLKSVQAVLEFLFSASCHLYPQQDRCFHKDQPMRKEFTGSEEGKLVWIYVFEQNDLPYLDPNCVERLQLLDNGVWAGYHGQNRIIKLREDCNFLSPYFKGLLLLHEGRHARGQQIDGEQAKTDLHEYQALCFDYEWTWEYGGPLYQQLLDKWMAELRPELEARLETIRGFPEPAYPPELDRILGTARYEFERYVRKLMFYRHAMFRLVQEEEQPAAVQAERLKLFLGRE